MKPKIVIFDLDGTLIDCTERYYRTYRDVLHQYGLKAPKKEELIRLRRLTGMSTRELLSSYLIPGDLKKKDELVPEIAEKRIVMFEDWTYLKLDNTFPGVEETLEKLLGMDIALMLVTARRNRGNLIRQLEEKDLEKYFGKILCRNEFRDKEAMLSYLVSEYSIHQRGFMFTSDTKADLDVGRQMGGITVGVLSGLDSRKLIESSEPSFIIENVNYLSNLIETS